MAPCQPGLDIKFYCTQPIDPYHALVVVGALGKADKISRFVLQLLDPAW